MATEETEEKKDIDRKILRLTVPTVLSNISVPLLGLSDTAVAGHMGGEKYLAAIAVGSVMMSAVYWLFGFLRGGTSGLTATAFGAGDKEKMGWSLLRAGVLGISIGIVLMAVHVPVLGVLHKAIGASHEVSALAETYFTTCIYGAVPMMLMMAVTGWFVGMQATDKAMWINMGVSVLNVAFTLLFVYGFQAGFRGIAAGTLLAQWMILLPAAIMVRGMCRRRGVRMSVGKELWTDTGAWRLIFSVNSNLFFRSACLIVASMSMYGFSARIGDVATGANAVINQLFLFFSFFMDGFAYTGEALVGRYVGAGDLRRLSMAVHGLWKWTALVTAFFVLAYAAGLDIITRLLTDSEAVAESVAGCRLWVALIPLAGAAAFLYDGFYIGLTRTRPMLVSTVCGVTLFAVLLYFVPKSLWMLWMAFTCYLALRSVILTILFKAKVR